MCQKSPKKRERTTKRNDVIMHENTNKTHHLKGKVKIKKKKRLNTLENNNNSILKLWRLFVAKINKAAGFKKKKFRTEIQFLNLHTHSFPMNSMRTLDYHKCYGKNKKKKIIEEIYF